MQRYGNHRCIKTIIFVAILKMNHDDPKYQSQRLHLPIAG